MERKLEGLAERFARIDVGLVEVPIFAAPPCRMLRLADAHFD
jgi:hypothetical protein